MTNARSEDGLVHSLEKTVVTHPANDQHVVQAGFTWCLVYFTWKGGPRYHSPGDNIERKLEPTDDPVTCLKCMAGELGTDVMSLL